MAENQNDDLALVEGTYQLACNYYEAGDWPNAIKWLSVVVKENPNYEAAADLLHKAKEELKQIEYKAGQRALHKKRWAEAHDHFQKVANLDGNYLDVASLLERAKKGLELPALYDSVHRLLKQEEWDWDIIILKLGKIVCIDKNFRNANSQLNWALRQRRVSQQYAEALKHYDLAKQQDGEMNWKKAVDLLKEVNRAERGYKGVDNLLRVARKRLKLVIHYNKGSRYFHRQQWLRATWHLSKAYRIDSKYGGVAELQKDRQTPSGQRGKRSVRTSWGRLKKMIEVMDIIVDIIQIITFIVAAGFIGGIFLSIRSCVSAPPPRIDRIKVSMDGDQLELDQLPSLTSGEAVELEVIVIDTNGKEYTSDDLVCRWSVAPLGDEGVGINTDLCKTFYMPSQEYSQQAVVVEVEGLEQQFEPSDPISMKFDIVK